MASETSMALAWSAQLNDTIHAYEGLVEARWSLEPAVKDLDSVAATIEELTASVSQVATMGEVHSKNCVSGSNG